MPITFDRLTALVEAAEEYHTVLTRLRRGMQRLIEQALAGEITPDEFLSDVRLDFAALAQVPDDAAQILADEIARIRYRAPRVAADRASKARSRLRELTGEGLPTGHRRRLLLNEARHEIEEETATNISTAAGLQRVASADELRRTQSEFTRRATKEQDERDYELELAAYMRGKEAAAEEERKRKEAAAERTRAATEPFLEPGTSRDGDRVSGVDADGNTFVAEGGAEDSGEELTFNGEPIP